MIYSRQKGELVSENRSSEAETCAFIGKWCSSIRRRSKYIKGVHRALQGNPGMWDGKELQCVWCELHGESPAMFTANGSLSPSIFFLLKETSTLENIGTLDFAKCESAS